MTYSHTRAATTSFTISHARVLASRVATDLHLCSRFYTGPTEETIRRYLEELAILLKDGYVSRYEFGFQRDDKRVVCWRYEVDENGFLTTNDPPGSLVSWVDVAGASFYNYLWHTPKWWALTGTERDTIEESLPVNRGTGDPPGDGSGYWVSDKNYHTGGVSLGRSTFRPYS